MYFYSLGSVTRIPEYVDTVSTKCIVHKPSYDTGAESQPKITYMVQLEAFLSSDRATVNYISSHCLIQIRNAERRHTSPSSRLYINEKSLSDGIIEVKTLS